MTDLSPRRPRATGRATRRFSTGRGGVSPLPSVDRVLGQEAIRALIADHGKPFIVQIIRAELSVLRDAGTRADETEVAVRCAARLAEELKPSLRRVCNLTGTVLHTNLGRAGLPDEAITAAAKAMRGANNLEFDLVAGKRGEREDHLRRWLCRLTGAASATVVNNNAAAVFLTLNALALRREVIVSRGELIEIGGSFRIPEIMARAGCRLVDVGTTNRTHLRDYEKALGSRTGLVMSVHPSNYAVVGFTASPPQKEIAALARGHGVPYVIDLGSGALVDLARYGLPHEPTPMEALDAGADIVTFSGDKLLGGPQAGIIVGRSELVQKIDRNPLKRVVRLDKARIAALEAVLRLYGNPDALAKRLPTLRTLTRPVSEIESLGQRLQPRIKAMLTARCSVELQSCNSQIGSGSLPVDRLPSWCLALRPLVGSGGALNRLAAELRSLAIPIIGRIESGWLKLDLRCLEDEEEFLGALGAVKRG